jgi:hypothetical protein
MRRLTGGSRVDGRLRCGVRRVGIIVAIMVSRLVELGLITGRFLGEIGWFGGSVPVVVLMLAEQLQRLGGLSQDPDGLGPADIKAIGVAFTAEDVGDPINGGFEPDGIPGVARAIIHFNPC